VQLAIFLRADATPWTDRLARALSPEQPDRPLKRLGNHLEEHERKQLDAYPSQSSKVQRYDAGLRITALSTLRRASADDLYEVLRAYAAMWSSRSAAC
jgi:hypothetical protein